jgi:hypothetical protein
MVEVLHEVIPEASIAALFNPVNPTSEAEIRETQRAAPIIGVKLDVLTARDESDVVSVTPYLQFTQVGILSRLAG